MQYAWHIHHDILVEPLTESIEQRLAYIRSNKPIEEQELRTRLLKAVQGRLPAPVVAAGTAYGQARAYDQAQAAFRQAQAAYEQALAAYGQARTAYEQVGAYGQARTAYEQARAAYEQVAEAYEQAQAAFRQAQATYFQALEANMPAILALHAIECPDCPWDGYTLFPRAQ